MNRTPLKRYAPVARTQFRQAITEKAALLGLSTSGNLPIRVEGDYAIVGGRAFPRDFAAQRAKLEAWIERDGFDAVVEEVAYTWFNRLMAIRFMEVNGYLSHGFRVLGHAEGRAEPQILVEAENVSFPGLDAARVTQLKIEGDRDEELYRLLILEQCHELHRAMPFLFEPVSDESELLLPDTLLQSDSLVSTLVSQIPEAMWQEIEIIGWLYQFYISDRKDEVIGKVVASPDIPAATQLFTPNWIVKYMTQNSLGRQWLATYPDSSLRAQMDYYIEPAPQTEAVTAALAAQTPDALEIESLTLLDPACGSGHILVEAYDLFKAMYLERGYRAREIPRLILENNLFGLDIDPRAAQMAGFAVLMKGRADDRRLLEDPPHLHIHALHDSSGLRASELVQALAPDAGLLGQSPLEIDLAALLEFYEGAETFGALLRVPVTLEARLPRMREALEASSDTDLLASEAKAVLQPLLIQTEILTKKYDCVVANPPYMGSKFYCPKLKKFIEKNYKAAKGDLYTCFIAQAARMTKEGGRVGMITIPNWMFLSTYEDLRDWLLQETTIETMCHNGRGVFGSDFGSCAFTFWHQPTPEFKGVFKRLFQKQGSVASNEELAQRFTPAISFKASTRDFEKIPGSPIAYWLPPQTYDLFVKSPNLKSLSEAKSGMSSCNSERFLRKWHEVSSTDVGIRISSHASAAISGKRWFFYNKGGGSAKWFGYNQTVINWSNDGQELKDFVVNNPNDPNTTHWSRRLFNLEYFFRTGVTWSAIGSSGFGTRLVDVGVIPGTGSKTLFDLDSTQKPLMLAYLNSSVCAYFLRFLCPTLNFEAGDIQKLPVLGVYEESDTIISIAEEAISISRIDWDSFETSWDFAGSPLLGSDSLEGAFGRWETETRERRERLRELETENNRLFVAAYGLESEIAPDVTDEQITLAMADREADIKRLVSYAIGCLMGRYSIDESGLIFAGAGGEGFDPARYPTLPADADGILPVTDTLWFDDDLVVRVGEFLRAAYRAENFTQNLDFLAQSLGQKASETPEETLRRYLVSDFYRDHLRTYRNRPIYWLFSSGKEKAFGALVYLHRMNGGTLSRMRSEYVLPLLGRYGARIEQLAIDITETAGASRRAAEKELLKRRKQLLELQTFDERLRHRADEAWSLDLDDGVKVNYGKFADLLAEVKLVTGSVE
jgi:methylase of polypeptide subunit release factors